MRLWENKCDLMGKRMDFNAYGKLNVILWEEFSYGKINVILWEKKCYAFFENRTFLKKGTYDTSTLQYYMLN